jgi:protein TonB
MAIRIASSPPAPDARRIAALSVSFLAHACAALVVAIPLAATFEQVAPPLVEVSVLERPPAPPPAEPEPPVRLRATPPVPIPRRVQVPTPAQVAVAPVAASLPVGAPIEVAVAPPPGAIEPGVANAGESRLLAYAQAPRLAYPRAALRQRAEGTVLLHVLVDAEGRAQRIELSRSSGHRELDEAARAAVERARFRPVLEGGVAVSAWGYVPIEFRLSRG